MTRSYIGGMRDSESIQFALWLHRTRGYSDSSAANLAYRVRFAQKRGILTPEQVDEKDPEPQPTSPDDHPVGVSGGGHDQRYFRYHINIVIGVFPSFRERTSRIAIYGLSNGFSCEKRIGPRLSTPPLIGRDSLSSAVG